ncbi:DUF1003 domain-containing protein [Hansschlegelia quercus]|uniref:DUF1003 domain-containing protein n=1 Tax=Hansschlegelia quercus TaxID=2528245 RepID=A0A4Q9GQX9_9HYPH|nr:DUF1003 domain-containing protein [Hansschlegelia quercus]TBN54470.1 DUF1003 domain-containing protein [Hansschlegelia quercus]
MTIPDDRADRITQQTSPEELGPVLDRNIRHLKRRRKAEAARASTEEVIARRITAVAGSMAFVYVHLAAVVAWVLVNLGLVPFAPAFDPTFVILATAASVEAIFLSTFVLISQNRDAAMAERRAELDLHINLLSEREITTLVGLMREIAKKLDVPVDEDRELDDAERKIAPEKVLDRLDA